MAAQCSLRSLMLVSVRFEGHSACRLRIISCCSWGQPCLPGVRAQQLQQCALPNSSVRRMQVEGFTAEPRTTLKYAIEVALPRTTRLLGVLEPFLERVVYEVRIAFWR